MPLSPQLLQALLTPDVKVAESIASIPDIIQSQLDANRKRREYDLKLQQLQFETEKQQRVKNIISTSTIDGEFSPELAAKQLNKAGYNDEAVKLEKGSQELEKGTVSLQTSLQKKDINDLEIIHKQATQIGSTFGSVMLVPDNQVEATYAAAIEKARSLGSDFINEDQLNELTSATSVPEMRSAARSMWFAAGSFKEQSKWILDQKKLQAEGVKGGTDKLVKTLIMRATENWKQHLPPYEGFSPDEVKLLDKKLGSGQYINQSLQVITNSQAGIEMMNSSPDKLVGMIKNVASALKKAVDDTRETGTINATHDSISTQEIQQLKDINITPEKFAAYRRANPGLSPRQVFNILKVKMTQGANPVR